MKQSRLISRASAIEKLEQYIPGLPFVTLMRYTSELETLVNYSLYDADNALVSLRSAYETERNTELIRASQVLIADRKKEEPLKNKSFKRKPMLNFWMRSSGDTTIL